jgi:bifunctional oligoribonuclease and PAP phosphatase NrnA
MYYKESKKILEEIKKAKSILLNCHRSPDPDSVGSALSMARVLRDMGKKVKIVCPTEEIEGYVKYLKGFDEIETVDFSSFDYSKFDLFIVMDSSSWDMVTNDKELALPQIPLIVIDHHDSNKHYGSINLVDNKTIACCEILFWLYKDWDVDIDKDTADALMAGIIGDSGAFRFPDVTSKTLKAAQELMDAGADKNKAIHYIYRSEDFRMIKLWGEVLSRMEIDKKHRFVWSAIPYEIFSKHGKLAGAREAASSSFTQSIDGTDFGFVAIEQKPGILSTSFRSRTGFDTTQISTDLGGGGHIYASGAKIEMPFDEAVEKVLKTARKFANKYN